MRQTNNYNVLVMELLCGEDMSIVRDKSRKKVADISNSSSLPQSVPLPPAGAAYLALEMLRCLQDLHDAGYVHRGKSRY